jgi:hypothetical protein
MKSRYIAVAVGLFILLACRAPQSPAEKIFGTVWLENYVPHEPPTSAEEDWATDAKKAKCYVCHVKGKSKKYCNSYGDVLAEWLDSNKFEKDRVEAEGELVKSDILAALKKAESCADACGTPFGKLFESGGLPNTEMGSKSAAMEKAAEDNDAEEVAAE